MRISERFALPYILKPADHEAGVDGDSVHGGKIHSIEIALLFGAITGDAVLRLYSGASAGTKTTAETFRYRLADADQAAAGADNFADWATSSALTLTAATYDNKILLVQIDSAELTDGQPWVTLNLSNAADALNAAAVGIARPRHAGNDVPTVIS